MGWASRQIGRRQNCFKNLTGKPTGKGFIRRPGDRWEDNIRMDLKEIVVNARNWVNSGQVKDYCKALVNATLNLWVTKSTESVS